ncbi:MAG TPA: hypothetical protein VFQ85_13500 [Mycobacteriales bacterium]|jgi:hypothetical protein|nr:hypothetical protein [Mycobacteriales bacterium]
MAGNADVLGQLARVLMQRASVPARGGYRRSRAGEDIGLSRRPNAPKFVTIVLAVLLTVVGLAVSHVYEIRPILDFLADRDVELTRQQGYLALLASPALLVVGSFFRGI